MTGMFVLSESYVVERLGRLTVHQHRFRNIVCVVAGYDMVDIEDSSSSIESLPPEDTAECAVILFPNLRDDRVHSPPVQLVI